MHGKLADEFCHISAHPHCNYRFIRKKFSRCVVNVLNEDKERESSHSFSHRRRASAGMSGFGGYPSQIPAHIMPLCSDNCMFLQHVRRTVCRLSAHHSEEVEGSSYGFQDYLPGNTTWGWV